MSHQLPSAHPSYEASGIRWIGEYPSSWTLTRVKFESYVKARVGWHGLKSDDFTDEGPYLVTGTDFSGSRIDWKNCHHCDDWRYEQDPYIQLREGDLLITKDGTIGKLALVEQLDGKATLNSGVFVVRPLGASYISLFYFWLLQSSVFNGFVEYRKTGSTIVHLYQETFENFSFSIPGVKEQTQIVRFLDYETAKIDALIEKQQQLITLLKDKRQAVISHAVTKGLNPDTTMRDSGVEWLGEIPAHWDVRPFRHVFQVSNGQVDPRISPYSAMPLVAPNHIESGTGRLLSPEPAEEQGAISGKYEVREGDVIYSKIRPALRKVTVAPEACLCSADMYALRPIRGGNPKFFSWLLLSEYFSGIVVLESMRVAMPKVNRETLAPIPLPVPSPSEQQAIADHLSTQTARLDAQIHKANVSVELLKERRTALISAAVTGKIDVRGWKVPESETEAEVA